MCLVTVRFSVWPGLCSPAVLGRRLCSVVHTPASPTRGHWHWLGVTQGEATLRSDLTQGMETNDLRTLLGHSKLSRTQQ